MSAAGEVPDATGSGRGGGGAGPVVVADLGDVSTAGADGVVWSLPHGSDLDANLVHLGPGGRIEGHVNHEVDVLVFVVAGAGVVDIDGEAHELHVDVVALVGRGAHRAVVAGPRGLSYLSVHRRRPGLTIGTRRDTGAIDR